MNKTKKVSLYIMIFFYVVAGANHLWHPLFYINIMPPWLPDQYPLVYISGLCEIAFGIMLLPLATRRIAAWCIIALLIAVFPANVQMMLNYLHDNKPNIWITIVRLPIQFLLIWWAYTFTKKHTINLKLKKRQIE